MSCDVGTYRASAGAQDKFGCTSCPSTDSSSPANSVDKSACVCNDGFIMTDLTERVCKCDVGTYRKTAVSSAPGPLFGRPVGVCSSCPIGTYNPFIGKQASACVFSSSPSNVNFSHRSCLFARVSLRLFRKNRGRPKLWLHVLPQ